MTASSSSGHAAESDAIALEPGDAMVAAMAAAGVDYLFFTSGSELAFYQEAIAKAQSRGRPAPRLLLFTHEYAAINAALGYCAASGKPAATAAHVDVGTQHYGAGIHSAMRSRLPLLLTAGVAPTAPAGSRRGSRDAGHFWSQDVHDQNAIVRQYMKWTRRIEMQDHPGFMVSRALQVALTPPRGPVYLAIPREIALSREACGDFASVHDLGVPAPQGPDAATLNKLARMLREARNPAVILGGSGRSAESAAPLVRLCETLGMPALDCASRSHCSFPMDHPLYQATMPCAGFDFLLVIDCDVPWVPGKAAPDPGCFVCVIDEDPVKLDIPTYEFPAAMRLTCDSALALEALVDEVERGGTVSDAAARRAAWAAKGEQRRRAVREKAESLASLPHIDPNYLAWSVGEIIGPSCVLVDDTLGHNPMNAHLARTGPGRYFRNPGSAGGWGPGAALGVKLARPEQDVVLVTGDGFYMYGSATSALLAAVRYGAPYLTVIFQNRSYSTTTRATMDLYPGGYAVQAGLDGGYLEPAMDFAKEAEAAGAYGENVRAPAELAAALGRCLARVRDGQPAVLAVWLPKIGEKV